MRERDLTNAGSDEENERGGRGSDGKGKKKKEDHEDGCISEERDVGSEERATSRLRLEPLR